MSQAPGFSGTPETGHCSSAATRASCASSSAVVKSPTMRASPAISRADSMRQIASIARCASPAADLVMATAPSHALVLEDFTDLEGPALVRCALQPLEGLVHRAHLPQPVPGDQLLGLGEWPVDDAALVAVEPNAPALRAGMEPSRFQYDARLDKLIVELLVLRHRRRRRGSRRLGLLAFLGQYQHTHLCLLHYKTASLLAWPIDASSSHRVTGGDFDIKLSPGQPAPREASIASFASLAMKSRSAKAATYSAHHKAASRLRPTPIRVAAAMYAQVMVSAMSARSAELPMARLARRLRQARIGMTSTAAAATARPSADASGSSLVTRPARPTPTT